MNTPSPYLSLIAPLLVSSAGVMITFMFGRRKETRETQAVDEETRSRVTGVEGHVTDLDRRLTRVESKVWP